MPALIISNADWIDIIDPVCGAPIDSEGAYLAVHGGAVFSFCTERCRLAFIADPSRWAVSALLGGVRATIAGAATAPSANGVDLELDLSEQTTGGMFAESSSLGEPELVAEDGTLPDASFASLYATATATPTTNAAAAGPAAAALPSFAPSGDSASATSVDGRSLSPMAAWRERQFAKACCHELLKVYREVASRRPDADRTALYRQVVMTHTRCDGVAAEGFLRRAEESFASWPASRDLTLRDVVHLLVVSEFLDTHPQSRWVQADLKRIVQEAVPPHL